MANSKETSSAIAQNGGLWGSVVSGVVDLTNGFNFRKQENDIAMAQINAEAIKSANDAERSGSNSKTIIIVVIVIAVLIMAMMFAGKK